MRHIRHIGLIATAVLTIGSLVLLEIIYRTYGAYYVQWLTGTQGLIPMFWSPLGLCGVWVLLWIAANFDDS